MTSLPSRDEAAARADRLRAEGLSFTADYLALEGIASGRLVDREAITETMVERMAESRYNARFGGFAWTDPTVVTDGFTRDQFMNSARRDLVAALGVPAAIGDTV